MRWLVGGVAVSLAAVSSLVAFTYLETKRVQKIVPVDGEFLTIDGTKLHYLDRGEGRPLVLIHGLGGQLRNFHYLLDRLAQSHRVIAIDRPGSGYSSSLGPSQAGIRAQARLVVALMEQLGLEKPLLVGHSLGGAIALAAGLDFPEKVGGLALIAPLTQMLETVPPAFQGLTIEPASLRVALAWTLVAPLSRWGPRAPMEQVFAPDPVPKDFEARAGGALSRRPRNFQVSANELRAVPLDLPGLVARYGELRVPTAVLFGRGDTILDPELHGQLLALACPQVRLEIVEGGHMLPVTHPQETADWILSCFNSGE